MMIHTIISENDIFFNSDNYVPSSFVNVSGGLLECKEFNGESTIVRLHSTNPYLYLMQEYQPSQIYKKPRG